MYGSVKWAIRSAGLPLAWLVIFGIFCFFLPEFATLTNIETMIRQTSIIGFAAVGMTFVIITGAIDLSIGSLVALVTVVIAWCLRESYGPELALAAGIAAGAIGGAINGLLVTKLKVGAFIVTLATLLAFRGMASGLAEQKTIRVPDTWLGGLNNAVPAGQKWMVFPVSVWAVFVVAGIASLLLRRSVFGKHVIATGSNEATARLCGVNTQRIQLKVFILAGVLIGLAGLMQFSRLGLGDPTVAKGLELSVIAAVVIGGASLSGGEGSIFGALMGALIMNTISTGASQLGWDQWVQDIATGAIIVVAVGLDRWRHSRAAR